MDLAVLNDSCDSIGAWSGLGYPYSCSSGFIYNAAVHIMQTRLQSLPLTIALQSTAREVDGKGRETPEFCQSCAGIVRSGCTILGMIM